MCTTRWAFMTCYSRKLVDMEAVESWGAWLAFRAIGLISESTLLEYSTPKWLVLEAHVIIKCRCQERTTYRRSCRCVVAGVDDDDGLELLVCACCRMRGCKSPN